MDKRIFVLTLIFSLGLTSAIFGQIEGKGQYVAVGSPDGHDKEGMLGISADGEKWTMTPFEKLIGEKSDLGITCALIPTSHKGVNIGRRHFPLNATFMNGPNSGKDVFIPMDWIIGGQPMVGQGWRMLMECLAAGRSISLPAQSIAAGKFASMATGAYSRVRQQFKTPIGKSLGSDDLPFGKPFS